jgi:hypothetical protein
VSRRDPKDSPQPADYEVLDDPADALLNAYVAWNRKPRHLPECEYHSDYGQQAGRGWVRAIEGQVQVPEKGKYIFLVLESPYEAPGPGTGIVFSSRAQHQHWSFSCSEKGVYKKLVETMRSALFASHHGRQQFLFPVSETYEAEVSDEQRARFHALVDKKLMGSISGGEVTELEGLESALCNLEEHDPEERSLRDEWSRRLDGAINALREINRQLEILVASGK